MTINVTESWHQIGNFDDGTPVRAVEIFNDKRLVGRVVDMGGAFRADFVNVEGECCEIILPNYHAALMRVAEEAMVRAKRLH